MYNAVFIRDDGLAFSFGKNGNNVFDMDVGDGVSVGIGTSQGFSQIGETVKTQSVSGRTITVKGAVYGNIQERKASMRKVLAPFSSGRLVFNDEYYARVYVKQAPTFSPVKNQGRFSLQFFAPFPFFYNVSEKNYSIGNIIPLFSFPVNYSAPHKFGEKGVERYTNIVNSGDVKVPYKLKIQTRGASSNIVVANLQTFEFLKINGEIGQGDEISIYRDEENVFRAELERDGETIDIIHWIDESSTLFELNVGDNQISVTDDNGGISLSAFFSYNQAVVALYET